MRPMPNNRFGNITTMNKIKKVIYDLQYIFVNYFIAYIPFWAIRKIMYKIFGLKIGKGSRINMRCILMSYYRC